MTNRISEAAQNFQETERLIIALSPEQWDRLQGLLEVLLANKEGRTTEADVMSYIVNLPQEDILAFLEIMNRM